MEIVTTITKRSLSTEENSLDTTQDEMNENDENSKSKKDSEICIDKRQEDDTSIIQNILDEINDTNDEDDEDDEDDDDEDDDEDDEDDDDEDEDDNKSTDFEEDDDTKWLASTVMYIPKIIDEKLLTYFQKYINKESNKDRIFSPSMTVVEYDDDVGDQILDETQEVVDEHFRKCKIARDTQTLQKLYNMMEDNIDHAADKFIEKFNFFNIVSTKEDYNMMKFEPGDFYKEHIECSSLDDDSDGSSRRICVYLILESPEKGGVFEFSYQGVKIKPEAGSIIMFPSCPLHPLRVTKVQNGNLMYVTNFLL
jgi:hypothetical protein